ncbi:MAG: TIGR04551 family protein [Myxococcales bacterium]|nr:TIGR04551 family protein [Myxococcales bacterium]MBK7193775.1 TIGR04551 family protein [Myxococcales bacterium]MBP6843762.1 TIGR04551 family protein [Kofleriaceae bacterium]
MFARSPRLASILAAPALTVALASTVALPSTALAQPSPMPTGGPPAGEEEPKPAGVAEAAPKAATLMATTPAVPARRDTRKKYDVVRLDGYLRGRGDWFKNLNLGFADDPAFGGAPFAQPLTCRATPATAVTGCDDTITSSNLRLRLEPRFELSNTMAVHTQIDLLDNVVMGSTPDGSAPFGAFGGGGTVPPLAGGNSDRNSIVVRRAWGEVATALALIKFGRMPDHFGLGIVANSGRRADSDYATWETLWMPGAEANVGGANDTSMDLDSDYGDTVDRLMISAEVPGTALRAAAAYDYPATGLTTGQTDAAVGASQPWDLDDTDDVSQWMLAVAKMDAPADFQEQMDRGDLALNFAGRLTYRSQDLDYDASGFTTGGAADPDAFVRRGVSQYIGDAWVKLGYKKVLFEAEVAGAVGSVDSVSDIVPGTGEGGAHQVDIRTLGAVARVHTTAFDDKLGYGLELGLATGDDADNAVEGRTHLRNASFTPAANDHSMSRFVFDPDYKVDLILFRELIGAVSNAFYVRPRMSYKLTKSITFRAQNVTSAAMKTVSTPGNDTFWGTEFDGDLGYDSGGFHMGLAYGVLFPLAAMDHPDSIDGATDPEFPFGTNNQNAGVSGNAHTFQFRLGVEF